jgi:hypothetical protein
VATFTANGTPASASVVRIVPDTLAVEVADSVTFRIESADTFGNPITNREVRWTSLNPTVVAVDTRGAIVGLKPGLAQLRAQVDSTFSTALIRVIQSYDGMAIKAADGLGHGMVLYDKDGSRFAEFVDTTSSRTSGLVYTLRDLPFPVSVSVDSAGLPDLVRMGSLTLTFANWTMDRVDIAAVDSTGAVRLFPSIPLSAEMRSSVSSIQLNTAELRASRPDLMNLGASRRAASAIEANVTYDEWKAEVRVLQAKIEAAQLAVCIGGAGSLPTAVVVAACSGEVKSKLAKLVGDAVGLSEDQLAALSSAVGVIGGTAECAASPPTCVFLFYEVANLALNDILLTIENFRNLNIRENIEWLRDNKTRIDLGSLRDGAPDGNGQNGLAGHVLSVPLRVAVYHLPTFNLPFSDPAGKPLKGVPVRFAVTSGGGTVTSEALTNNRGEAFAVWKLGSTLGTQTVQASLPGAVGSPTFFAIATSGASGPPTVTITSPKTGATISDSRSLQLSGSAVDVDGRAITAGSLSWTSDVDGALGQGGSVQVNSLRIGTHTISLTATDVRGVQASARQVVTVIPSCNAAAAQTGETHPGGTIVPGSQAFTKTWTLKNVGSCSWLRGWKLRYIRGPLSVDRSDLSTDRVVEPGQSFVFGVRMSAPAATGTYLDEWQLFDDAGVPVIVGVSSELVASVRVVDASATLPKVTEVSPARPVTTGNPQAITIFGLNFKTSATLVVVRPDGSSFSAAASAVQQVTTTSMTAQLILSQPGSWSVSLVNLDGTRSTPFVFEVASPGAPDLLITNGSLAPSTIAPSGRVTVSWMLTNQGSGPANASATVVRVNQSSTSAGGANAASVAAQAMPVGVAQAQTASITAPASLGTHWVWLVADNAATAGQSSGATGNDAVRLGSIMVSMFPGTPTNASPGSSSGPGPTLVSSSATVSWGAETGATSYNLVITDIATNALVVQQNVNGTSFTPALAAGRQYRWSVAACNSTGCSSFTTPLYFQTPAALSVPGTPTNASPGLTSGPGSNLGSSSVTVSWGAVSGATSYSLVLTDIAANSTLVNQNVNGTSFTAALTAGRQYRWNVAACNSAGCSTFSTPLFFQTLSTVSVPGTPTSTSPGSTSSPGPVLGGSSVTASWAAVNGATAYSLAVRDIAANSLVVNQNVSGTSFTATLTAGRQYRWNVAACNSAGCSTFTTQLYFQTPVAVGLPGAITLTSATASCSGNSPQVVLNWSASNGAVTYTIYRNGAVYASGIPVGTQTYTNNANLTSGTTYTYSVQAINANGSTNSNTQSATVPTCGAAAPGAFSLTSATASCSGGSPQIVLSWGASSGVVTYTIYRNGVQYAAGIGAGTQSYTNNANLTPGASYTYHVQASNATGNTNSNTQTVTAPSNCGATAPGAFSLTSATASCSGNSPQVVLNWGAASGVVTYTIYRNGAVYAAAIGAGTQSYTNNANLTPGASYTYYVQASNATGNTNSNTQTVTAPSNCGATAPGAFSLTSATASCSGSIPQIVLNWSAASGVVSYTVYRNGVAYASGISAGTQSYTNNANLTPGVSYTYSVQAINATGSTNSNTQSATAPSNCGATAPGAFTLSSATASCSGSSPQVVLNWGASSGVVTYTIYRNGVQYATGIGASTLSYTNSANLTPGASYTYFVQATNATGSTSSNSRTVTAPSNCGATAPGAFSLTSAASCSGSSPQVVLNWGAASGVVTYTIYRNGAAYAAGIGAGTQSYTNNANLTPGASYSYYVQATNATGSTNSNTQTATAPSNCGATAPGAFTLTSATASCSGSTRQIVLSWGASSGVATYSIYRNGAQYATGIPAGTLAYTNSANLTAGASYTYYIQATNATGSTNSNTRTATAPTTCP